MAENREHGPEIGRLCGQGHSEALHLRTGTVLRNTLIERLAGARSTRVVTIVAPAGYGKTTLLSQWCAHEAHAHEARRHAPEGRPTAWLSLDEHDDDPATLCADLAAALRNAGLLGRGPGGPPRDSDADAGTASAARADAVRMANALYAHGGDGILVLDGAEALRSQASNDLLAELAASLPASIQLVIASRAGIRMPLARLRVQGALLELTAADLAMDHAEARQLLANAGVDAGDDLGELMERTEGWVVGLQAAASAARAGSTVRVRGTDRGIAAYLRRETLDGLAPADVSFLLQTSILDDLRAPLCDAVLGEKGAAETLERLVAAGLPLVALDRTGDRYRYPRLLREFLRAALARKEPRAVTALHRRAAQWYGVHDVAGRAVQHAQAAGAGDVVAPYLAEFVRRKFARGRAEIAHRWLHWFERTANLAAYPDIAASGGVVFALTGDAAAADRCALALSAGDAPTTAERILRSILGRNGLEQMRIDARAAQSVADRPWRPAALALEGFAHLWAGDVERADAILAQAVSIAEESLDAVVATAALGARAAIAAERDDWSLAGRHASRSLDHIQRQGLHRYATSGLSFAVAARYAAAAGQIESARRLLAQTTVIRPALTTAAPGISVHTQLELANAHLMVSDVRTARALIRESAGILAERHDLGRLSEQHRTLGRRLEALSGSAAGMRGLTTAELRLLPHLVTHLSFHEIGERLFVSRNTVKTQAISIYHKLGASSRSEAIRAADAAGLLEGLQALGLDATARERVG